VPTLDEVLALTRGKATLLVELKGEGTEQATINAVKERGMDREVIFTSFNVDRIQTVKKMDDKLSIGAILPSPGKDDIQRAKDLGAVGFGVNYRNLCLWMVEEANALGLDIRA
jgi:glycerophosphoryl diester phosphodiesterase